MIDRPGDPVEPADDPTPPVSASTSPLDPGRSAVPARRRAVLSLAVGVLLLISAPVAWFALRPAPAGQSVSSVGADRAEALREVSPAGPALTTFADGAAPAAGTAGSDAGPAPSDSVTPMAPPTDPAPVEQPPSSADEAPAAPPAAVDPARIVVPALGVDAAVVPVGVQASGELEIPVDVSTVGWYRFGPVPGSDTGSAVVTGHVDAADQGPGTFSRLGDLQPGDTMSVQDSAGISRDFTVVAREEWSKGEVPLDRLFDRGGQGRLVLITCGGSFDENSLSYEDNVAVTAVLSGS